MECENPFGPEVCLLLCYMRDFSTDLGTRGGTKLDPTN